MLGTKFKKAIVKADPLLVSVVSMLAVTSVPVGGYIVGDKDPSETAPAAAIQTPADAAEQLRDFKNSTYETLYQLQELEQVNHRIAARVQFTQNKPDATLTGPTLETLQAEQSAAKSAANEAVLRLSAKILLNPALSEKDISETIASLSDEDKALLPNDILKYSFTDSGFFKGIANRDECLATVSNTTAPDAYKTVSACVSDYGKKEVKEANDLLLNILTLQFGVGAAMFAGLTTMRRKFVKDIPPEIKTEDVSKQASTPKAAQKAVTLK